MQMAGSGGTFLSLVVVLRTGTPGMKGTWVSISTLFLVRWQ